MQCAFGLLSQYCDKLYYHVEGYFLGLNFPEFHELVHNLGKLFQAAI